MSWRDVEKDWDAITGDARRFMSDARHLGQDIERQAEIAGEEVVAAEYLATGNLLEWLSAGIEDGRELVLIGVRQWRYLFEDGLESFEQSLGARNLTDLSALPAEHLRRRSEHLQEGFDEVRTLARRAGQRACEPLRSVWRPFTDMVRRDWSAGD